MTKIEIEAMHSSLRGPPGSVNVAGENYNIVLKQLKHTTRMIDSNHSSYINPILVIQKYNDSISYSMCYEGYRD
jgi:hypothetical protein